MPSAMHISKWGPAFWHALHTAAYAYPVKPTTADRLYMKAFIISTGGVLPCKECCTHYTQYLRQRSMDQILKDRDSVAAFVVDVHNEVNKRQKPKKRVWEKDEAKARWTEDGRTSDEPENCPAFARVAAKPDSDSNSCSLTPWALLIVCLVVCGVLMYMLHQCRSLHSAKGKRVSVRRLRVA